MAARILRRVSAVRLRIVSDQHLGERSSRVAGATALTPLFDGAAQVVLNGDSVETLFLDRSAEARAHKAEFDAFAAAHAARLRVITGNHDPDISPLHHLDAADGRILITHGDLVFPQMTPWGWEPPFFLPEFDRRLRLEPPESRSELETRLRLCKAAMFAIRNHSPRLRATALSPWKRWRVFNACLRSHRVLRAWHTMPDAAAAMLAAFRPLARVLIFGHVHRPGAWWRDGRLLLNTGSASWPLGGRVVDLTDEKLVVRDLVATRHAVSAGRVRAEFGLAETFARTPPAASAMLRATS